MEWPFERVPGEKPREYACLVDVIFVCDRVDMNEAIRSIGAENASFIGLDVETDRLNGVPLLIQIATVTRVYLFDLSGPPVAFALTKISSIYPVYAS